ncbi:GGDEF domain-containing protein [Aerococcus agrisoli]|uniref:GGDEF domain-containing protein n=1 Tax=Aerococcus agrisoli TaxID=2487350 RepID=UPI001F37413A|nr:GGDEF domain-containing protein [Aerococcus agrisoli]
MFASIFVWLISNFTDDLNDLYETSVRDGLTTLYNSRKLEEDLRKISDNNSSYSILILDVDNFKKLNDTYGHTIGDKALEEIGVIFNKLKNELFDYYRYGGEEFVAIVFDCTGEKTLKLADDIHSSLKEMPLVSHEGNDIPVTVSIGIAHRKPHEDMRVTLRRADEALYRAKREGKNRTVASDDGLNFDYLNFD